MAARRRYHYHVAGNGAQGYSGDGGLATSASLSYPRGVAFDSSGNMYIADTYNNRIRKVSAQSGVITTVAGNGTPGFGGDGGPATAAMLSFVTGVAVDSSGNIYIADFSNERIRRVDAATGIISTIAGNGEYGYSGDNGLAINAELKSPENVAVDSRGNVYIADFGNGRVRAVNVERR